MKSFLYSVLIISVLILFGCQSKFPLNKDLTKQSYKFFNQDSVEVTFPGFIKGKTAVMGFIYTNCPDICPMTTHNMIITDEKLTEEGINDVQFILLTFDPDRDTPSVLKKYAEVRGINFDNWTLLWGDKENTDKLLIRFDVMALPSDSSYSDDGELNYYMIHTDRISLIDKDGRLRKNYQGSKVNLDELLNDIKELGE